MDATRRAWGSGITAVLVAGLAGLVRAPLLLLVPISVCAWIIGRQYLLYRSVVRIQETLEAEVVLSRKRAFVDQPLTATLSVTRHDDCPGTVEATMAAPPGVSFNEKLRCELTEAETTDTSTATFSVSAAGRYTLPPVTVKLTEPTEFFSERFEVGGETSVTIEPRTPRDLHIGQGGDAVVSAYGDHAAGRSGSGITPAELRQYTPGDTADRIDWKATARLNEPYVREFEAETDRRTVLVVDHRATTALGPPGQTILAYIREAGIGAAESAAASDDPLGLWTVGNAGVTIRHNPASGRGHYERVLRDLRTLEATVEPSNKPVETLRPIEARRRANALSQTETQFAEKLQPYFATQTNYVTRLTSDPLFNTVQRIKSTTKGSIWTVLITTDRNRRQLQETVQQATADGDHVLVLVAPTTLFDQDQDIESAYSDYTEFEEFRQQLDRIPRVTALELAPGNRLDRILAVRQGRQ